MPRTIRRTELRPEYGGKEQKYACASEDEQESMGALAAPDFLQTQGRGGNHAAAPSANTGL